MQHPPLRSTRTPWLSLVRRPLPVLPMINTLYTSVLLAYDAPDSVAASSEHSHEPASLSADTHDAREARLPRTFKALRLAFASVLG